MWLAEKFSRTKIGVFRLFCGAFLACAIGLSSTVTWAGEADVIDVQVEDRGDGNFTFSATLKHADEGWDHYANVWRVLAPDGTVLGVRELLHPHVNEQPFTRSLSGVSIPDGITEVTIEAGDSVHDTGGATMTVQLPGRS